MINLTVDNQIIQTSKSKSVIEPPLDAGIYISHLCYHPDPPPVDECKLGVVGIEGIPGFCAASPTPASNKIVVKTKTELIARFRQQVMIEILSRHPDDCGTCTKYPDCELQSLKRHFACDNLSCNGSQIFRSLRSRCNCRTSED